MSLPQTISDNKKFCKLEDVSFAHTTSLIGKTIKSVKQTDQGLCWTIYFTDDTYLVVDSGRNTPAMILYPFEPE